MIQTQPTAPQTYTNQQVHDWFKANPNIGDVGIAQAMDKYGVGAQQVADVTGASLADVENRYHAAINQAQVSPTTQQPNINTMAAQAVQQAGMGAQTEMGYKPADIAAPTLTPAATATAPTLGPTATVTGVDPITAQQVTAGQLASTDLDLYMNPYTKQVIDTSLADLERQRQIQQNLTSAQAGAAKAFGGSRHGIAEAETNLGFGRTAGQLASGLRQAGFQQAQQAAQQDIASRMQAGLANQAANLQAQTTTGQQSLQAQLANQAAKNQMAQFGAGQQMQAALANQAARNQMDQFGAGQQMQAALANQQAGLAGSQQRLSAGSQLANIANLGFGMGQTVQQNLAQQGLQQQALQQALIDAAKGQYAGYTGAPTTGLGLVSSALGATATPQTTTQSKDPGLFDYLTLATTAKPWTW